jgi:23S rRNA (cytidine1920-2'-O)/16S rRNA (cytidine1409-2'-O)-methyltransferase
MVRRRIDVELVSRGLVPSREQARAAVLAGKVKVDGSVVTKAGTPVTPEAVIEVAEAPRFVSRGCAALDVGASTGGFTDCLLQRGAASVTALDVGYGQLAWSLRNDLRVTVLERTNIRTVQTAALGGPFDIVTIDVSFISLEKVLPAVKALLAPDGDVVALVKPQFEAGKGRVGKKGVVREASIHREVLERVVSAAQADGWTLRGLAWSPIRGPEGNIEFWAWLAATGEPASESPADIVRSAHEALGG